MSSPNKTFLPSGEDTGRINSVNKLEDQMKIELPPGTYYVGDPCYRRETYVFESHDREWNDFDSKVKIPLVSGSSVPTFIIYGNTEYGDGSYRCNVNGSEYPVDSGCLAVVRLTQYEEIDYGSVFTIKNPWLFEITGDFLFRGSRPDGSPIFEIPTADELDLEDEYDDDEDYDDNEGW